MKPGLLIFLEITLVIGVVLGFAIREYILMSPKNIAKAQAKEQARKEAYARKDAERLARKGENSTTT